MTNILISGLVNIETTLHINDFPLHYYPVNYPFFGINSTVSGVGYNLAKALTILGHPVNFVSIMGQDMAAQQVNRALFADRIGDQFVLDLIGQTAQSVILYDQSGRRQIHVDLKNIQEQIYPEAIFDYAMGNCSTLILCNVNFSRPFLGKAQQLGKLIATDVHAIANLEDDYNRDFMQAANILFMSHELLPMSPEDWARSVFNRYGAEIVVIGLGAEGALLAVRRDNFVERIPAVYTRPIVSTIGAGDALFSGFMHGYFTHHDPYQAIKLAQIFASYKIGTTSASEGFLDKASLEQWFHELYGG